MFNNDVISMHTREYRKDLFLCCYNFHSFDIYNIKHYVHKSRKSRIIGVPYPPRGVVKGDCENIIKKR